jgi:hypothetical protein
MKRFLLAPALAFTVSLAASPAPAQPAMRCADGFEAICNLIDCALG